MAEFDARRARAKRPMPLWVDAYRRDTQDFLPDENSAYLNLLMALWSSPDVALPDHPAKLAKAAGTTLRLWKGRVGDAIRPKLKHLPDGTVTQKRARNEALFVEFSVTHQACRKSRDLDISKCLKHHEAWVTADPTVELPRNHPLSNPRTCPTQQPNNPTVREKIPSSSTTTAAPARSPDDGDAAAAKSDPAPTEQTIRERVLSAIGADPVSGILGPNGVMLGGSVDMLEVDKWQAAGASDALILAVVRDRIAKLIGQGRSGPKSFKFFTDEILDRAKGAPAEGRSQPPPKRDLEEIAEGRRQREEIIRNMRKNDADEINNLPPRARPKAAGGGGA